MLRILCPSAYRRPSPALHNRAGRPLSSAALAAVLIIPLGAGRAHALAKHSFSTGRAGTITLVDRIGSGTLGPLTPSTSPLNYLLFAGLTAFDRRGHLVPDLLARLPSLTNGGISRSGTALTLDLKPHQYWSSGSEITSADVVFGWQAMRDLASGDLYQQVYRCKSDAPIYAAGRYRVVLRLKSPFAPLLTYCLPPVLPHSWSRLGHDPHIAALRLARGELSYHDSSYWTDGPFQILRFEAGGGSVVLAPMKYYRLHPGPHITELTFSTGYRTEAAFAAAAAAGGAVSVDAGGAFLPAIWLHRHEYALTLTPSLSVQAMQFNAPNPRVNGQPNPLRDPRVRQALSLALDRAGFASAALGIPRKEARTLVAYSPFLASSQATEMYATARFSGAWDPLRRAFIPYGSQSIRDARALLRSAGYGSGLDVQMLAGADPQGHIPGLSVIRQDWQAIGVRLRASAYYPPLPCNEPAVHGGNFQVYMAPIASGPDPNDLRYSLQSDFISWPSHPTSAPCDDNVSGVKDALIDAAFKRAAKTYDPARRTASYNTVAREVNVRAFWTPLYYVPNVFTHDRRITGVTVFPLPPLPRRPFNLFEGYAHNGYQWRYAP